MLKKLLFLFLLIILFSGVLLAAEEESSSAFNYSVFPTDFWSGKIFFGYTGFSFIEGQETSLETEFRGGWLTQYSYYSGSFLNRLEPVEGFDYTDAEFKTGYLQGLFGIRQGFVRNKRNDKNLIEGFLYYKGRWETHENSDDNSPWFMQLTDNPENDGIFQQSLVIGSAYNDVVRSTHAVKDGFDAGIVFDYAPSFINDPADYYTVVLEAAGYLPILDLNPGEKMNLFSIYLADRVKLAYTDGDYRPYNIRQENAASIRGIEEERLDSKLTIVNNFELRYNLPALFIPDLMFGLLTYFDAGYYYEDASYNGTVFSAGAGLYLDLFGAFQGGIRYDYLLKETRMDESLSSINMMLTFYF